MKRERATEKERGRKDRQKERKGEVELISS